MGYQAMAMGIDVQTIITAYREQLEKAKQEPGGKQWLNLLIELMKSKRLMYAKY